MNEILSGNYYHVFIKSKTGEPIFKRAHEKHLFLGLYQKFLSKIVETVAFSVMDNHAHWVLYVPEFNLSQTVYPQALIGKQMAHLLRAYSLWRGKRTGQPHVLFERGYQRKLIPQAYLKTAILFVSCNPVKHLSINDLEQLKRYPFCSYSELFCEKPRVIQHEKLVAVFGGEALFVNECERYVASNAIHKMKSALEV